MDKDNNTSVPEALEGTHTKTEKKLEVAEGTRSVPQLRFAEFDDEWEQKRTKEIAPLQRGFDLPTTQVIKGDYPVVYSNGILRKHIEYKVKGPGIVTGRSGTIGKVTYVEEDFWPHNTSLWVTSFYENDPKFIYYFYDCFNLTRYNAGSTVPTLNRNDVHSVKKYIPTLTEQQKIARFLTAVDTKLQQLTQKKELLQQYKKGVMQQLFPSTGSGQVPKLRFKPKQNDSVAECHTEPVEVRSRSYPDWEEKKLGEVLTIGSGRDYKHLKEGDFPVYGTGGYMTSVNEFLYDGESVGIGRKGTIDKPVFLEGKFWTVDTLFYTHSFKDVLPKFIYLKFQTINWRKYNEASGVPSLSKATLDKIKIEVPFLEEQQQIASYLAALDTKIEQVTEALEATQQFKKGLLQQLFV